MPTPPQVMDALYQIRVRKADTDLTIDQLRETLALLAAERAPGVAKLEKRLEEVRAAWQARVLTRCVHESTVLG